ncbi:MAG: CDP-glycerol glycerophosphotransferase family protein [Magnetococcus sp. YQC-9]
MIFFGNLSGRHLLENPYRELIIKRQLEQRGVEVKFAVPGRGLNQSTPPELIEKDEVLRREGAFPIRNEEGFRRAMRGCQMVVFSTWRSYLPLAQMARAEGRLTINFCATAGLDHWTHGVERCLIRSRFIARQFRFLEQNERYVVPSDDQLRIVGSIQYEYPPEHRPFEFADREAFCRYYDLDPMRPIAVLFPKGIELFHKKVALWFPNWDKSQVDKYNQWFLDAYAAICHQAREARCNLLVKMHPSAYASYKCDVSNDMQFWQNHPWIRVLDVGHTLSMYRHMDVGVGINSHSALDTALFNKPFVYVDSDIPQPPDTHGFKSIELSLLPPGPSTHWHTNPQKVNPWFWSWLGAFSRVGKLGALLDDPVRTLSIRTEDRQAFIDEYWGMDDFRASERIVNEIIGFGEERLGLWSRPFSRAFWRGRVLDGWERVCG